MNCFTGNWKILKVNKCVFFLPLSLLYLAIHYPAPPPPRPYFILWIVTFPIFIKKNLKRKLDSPNKKFVLMFLPWNHISAGANFHHLNLTIKLYSSSWNHVILSCIITKSYYNMPFCYSGSLNYSQQIYSYLTLSYCWGVIWKGDSKCEMYKKQNWNGRGSFFTVNLLAWKSLNKNYMN